MEALRQMLGQGLTVTDQFHRSYRISYFEFGLQTRDTSFNDTTGTAQPIENYISFPFYAAMLDSVWLPRILQQLAPSDTLFFDHIVAEDTVRKVRYGAPALRIGVR